MLMFVAAVGISVLLTAIIGITTLLWLGLMAVGAVVTVMPIRGLRRWGDDTAVT